MRDLHERVRQETAASSQNGRPPEAELTESALPFVRRSDRSVTLVVTNGRGSLDRYAQKLAEQLDVAKIETDIYQRTAELFNTRLISTSSARALRADLAFVRRLRALHGLVHLPNHHLARYGHFLATPYVVTVHDLIRYFDAKGLTPLIHAPNFRDRLYLGLDYSGIRKATGIIAVSEATKQDLVRHLSIPESKIHVVHEGIDHRLFRPVRRRLFDQPYVLFVGSEHPRKNLATLLEAFASLKRERRFRDLALVKVGRPGGREAPFRERTVAKVAELGLDRDVVFTGRVPDADLPAYYSGAVCFVLPSLYEGFGFPPLEAMACGCPVVASNAGAVSEVTSDAAVLVDPRDADGLAAALRRVLTDESLRHDLSRRGLERAQGFSWERTGRETMQVYTAVKRSLGVADSETAEPRAVRIA